MKLKRRMYLGFYLILVILANCFSLCFAQLLNDTLLQGTDSNFNRPTFFEPNDRAISKDTWFDYDLSQQQGKNLKVGDTWIGPQTVTFELKKLRQFGEKLSEQMNENPEAWAFFIKWPKHLFTNPTLELISRSGEVVWHDQLSDTQLQTWQEKIGFIRKALNNSQQDHTEDLAFSSTYAWIGKSNLFASVLSSRHPLRLCVYFVHSEIKNASSRYCSSRFIYRNQQLQFSKAEIPTRIILQSQEVVLKQTLKVSNQLPTSFYADLKGGESYEFISTPNELHWVDLVRRNEKYNHAIGFGTRPAIEYQIINQQEYSKFVRLIGFEATIRDIREFWQADIPVTQNYLYFPGTGGGFFRKDIHWQEVPDESLRVYLAKSSPAKTLSSSVSLDFKKPESVQVSSLENSVKNNIWNYKSENGEQINKSHLVVTTKDNRIYPAHYEIIRAYGNEFSTRFTGGLLSSSDQIILGEVLYSKWFEKIWGQNDFSYQRWGVAVKYFQSTTKLALTTEESQPLSVTNVDLKYRFTQGVWTQDETKGLIASYQKVDSGAFQVPITGIGWFWARSMPRSIDSIFKYLPFMNYPKWVDFEFIYYFNSLNPDITLNTPLNINFHGQVLWRPWLFGEAGFGLKRFAFESASLGQKAELNAFFGTIGLGIKF